MAKKIFARAKLVKKGRWTIDFTVYDPESGTEQRQRKDFELNDIEDLKVREEVANRIVSNISMFATIRIKKAGPTLTEAVDKAVRSKQHLPRQASRRKYPTVAKHFLKWSRSCGYDAMPVADFTRRHAREYWDHFLESKDLRARTRNNYLTTLRALWSELIDLEYIPEKNPFQRIKPARKEEKLRRVFTPEERRIVADYAEKNDYWMFRGILLQFYCYIRPVELCRLKFRDFDLARGLVTIQEGNAKSWRRVVKTIPASVLHYFVDGKFDKYPGNYLMFGRVGDERRGHMAPSTVPIDENRPYKRHAKVLSRLLPDTDGLTWYSWKDTGISLHVRKTSPVATKDQAGHTSLEMTSIYYHIDNENEEYRKLEHDLVM